jgi:hypothetical protein
MNTINNDLSSLAKAVTKERILDFENHLINTIKKALETAAYDLGLPNLEMVNEANFTTAGRRKSFDEWSIKLDLEKDGDVIKEALNFKIRGGEFTRRFCQFFEVSNYEKTRKDWLVGAPTGMEIQLMLHIYATPHLQHWWTMRAIEDSSEIGPIKKTDLKSRKSRESFLKKRLDDGSLKMGMVLNNCLFSYLLEDEDFSKGIIRDNRDNCVKYLHQKERESEQRVKKSETSFTLKDAVLIPVEPLHKWHGVGHRIMKRWETFLSQYGLKPGMTDSELKNWITG